MSDITMMDGMAQSNCTYSPGDPTQPPMPNYMHFNTSDSILVVDSLAAGRYDVKVSDMRGCGGAYNYIELTSPPALKVTTVPQELPTGGYFGCDTCADGSVDATVLNGASPFTYAWFSVPNGDVNFRLEGASIFFNDAKDVLSGDEGPDMQPISTDAQLTGVAPAQWYALVVSDQLGCVGTKAFLLERPKPDGEAQGWGLYGNDANGNTPPLTPPQGGGEPAPWLGTSDSTDLVMKANNQQQLRLGANGTTELLGGVKMTMLEDALAEPERIPLVDASGSITGGATIKSLYTSLLIGEYGEGCLDHAGNPIPHWESGTGKIFTDCSPVKVGIGTTDPLTKLDVRGNIYGPTISVNTYDMPARLTVRANGSLPAIEIQNTNGDASLVADPDGNIGIGTEIPEARFDVRDENGNPALRVFNDGKVVIGKGAYANTGETPIFLIQNDNQQIFKVNNDGIVWARDIKLTLDAFPDHVFKEEYELMSIEDLRNFITNEGHLPNIPKEEEIVSDGMKVSELITAQMEKIEELTLYIIQLNERIKELEDEQSRKE